MDDKVAVGLDIGSTKVCAVVGRVNEHGSLEVLGLGKAESVPGAVSKGVVLNVNKTIDAVNRAVEQAANQSNYDIGTVTVSVGGQNIQCLRKRGSLTRDTPGSEVLVEDIERLSNDILREPVAPGTAVLHVLPQEYVVDNWDNIYDPFGMTGMRLQASFQVITSPALAIENTRKSVARSRAHLETDALVFAPLAAALATLTDDEKEAGVALVDIGGGTTEVVIFYKKIVRHVAVIPFAGSIITSDIQQGCTIPYPHAELLKVKYGVAQHTRVGLHEVVSVPGLSGRPPKDVSLKNVAIVIEERLREIAALVSAEIIKSGFEMRLGGGIVLTGGTAQFEGIDDLFAAVSGKEVRIGLPNLHFGRGHFDVAENPMYATAIGLVWHSFRSVDSRDDDYQAYRQTLAPSGLNGTHKPKEKEAKKSFLSRLGGFLNDDLGDRDSY